MVSIKDIEKKCKNKGIPFSKYKKCIEKNKKTMNKNKKKKSGNKKKKSGDKKKKYTPKNFIPKGVIIRKNNKLYKSNGKKLIPFIYK